MAVADADAEPRLLLEQGKSIRQHFTALGSALVEDEGRQLYADAASSLANVNDRFFLWASNVGLFNPSHASLDYQLRDNEHVRTFTNDLLLTIDGLLQKVEEIALGLRTPFEVLDSNGYPELENASCESNGSDTSGEDITCEASSIGSGSTGSDIEVIFGGVDVDNNESEAELLVQQMGSVVDQLFSLALQIRNPITRKIPNVDRIDLHRHIHSSFKDQYIQMREAMEYQGLLQVFQQCRRESTQTPDNNGQSEDAIDDDDEILIHRLLQANRIRRCRFHYWKRYKIKSTRFAIALNEPDNDQLLAPSMPRTVVTRPSATLSVRQSELSHQISSRLTSAIPLPAAFVLNDNIAPSSKSSRAPTSLETGPDGLAVHWPMPPGGFYSSRKTKDFECPYCFFFCSSRTAKVEAWKNHLRFDLLPYQCTYPQCNEADTLFNDFDDWNLHEQGAHRRIWVCHIDQAQFAERSGYEEHVRAVHTDKALVLLTPELIRFRESTSKDCGRPCPVCLKGFQKPIDLQRHLARHLESIALLSLPAEDRGDESASQEKSSDQSRVAERRPFMIARSIANDFPEDNGKPLRFDENDHLDHVASADNEGIKLSFETLMLLNPQPNIASSATDYALKHESFTKWISDLSYTPEDEEKNSDRLEDGHNINSKRKWFSGDDFETWEPPGAQEIIRRAAEPLQKQQRDQKDYAPNLQTTPQQPTPQPIPQGASDEENSSIEVLDTHFRELHRRFQEPQDAQLAEALAEVGAENEVWEAEERKRDLEGEERKRGREEARRARRERVARIYKEELERGANEMQQERQEAEIRKGTESQQPDYDLPRPETCKPTAAAMNDAGISSQRDNTPTVLVEEVWEPAMSYVERSEVTQGYADDDIFDPNIFKSKKQSISYVLKDSEGGYRGEHISNENFFVPKEHLDSVKIDHSEGAPDINVYHAHDDLDIRPASYSFSATKDGQEQASFGPAPILDLIRPTPPGSRSNSPPPVDEPKEEPEQDLASKTGSRVSWRENQFHNYEVSVQDEYRQQFIPDHELENPSMQPENEIDPLSALEPKGDSEQGEASRGGSRVSWRENQFHNYDVQDLHGLGEQFPSARELMKYTQDEILLEVDSPNSGTKTSLDQSEQSKSAQEPEIPTMTLTEYDPDQEDSWDNFSEYVIREQKRKATAAIAAVGAAIALDKSLDKSSMRNDP